MLNENRRDMRGTFPLGDRDFLARAIVESEYAWQDRTYPIGAVLVGPQGEAIGIGRNRVFSHGDSTAHAEIDAIRMAGATLKDPAYKYQCVACCGKTLPNV